MLKRQFFLLLSVLLLMMTSTQAQAEESMSTQGVHHVGLTVRDIHETAAFFTELLDFKVVKEKPEYPAIFVTDGTVMVTLWQVQTETPVAFDRKTNLGLHHLALKVNSVETLHRYHERLKAAGVEIEFPPGPASGGPNMHMMFYEPGGVRLELFAPVTQ